MVQTPETLYDNIRDFVDSKECFFFVFFIMLHSLKRKNTIFFFLVEQVFLTKPSSPEVIQIAPARERVGEMERKIQRGGRIEPAADL